MPLNVFCERAERQISVSEGLDSVCDYFTDWRRLNVLTRVQRRLVSCQWRNLQVWDARRHFSASCRPSAHSRMNSDTRTDSYRCQTWAQGRPASLTALPAHTSQSRHMNVCTLGQWMTESKKKLQRLGLDIKPICVVIMRSVLFNLWPRPRESWCVVVHVGERI